MNGMRVAFTIALAALAPAPSAAGVPAAQAAYESVLRHMLDLPEPDVLTYDAEVTSRNGSFLLARDGSSGEAEFGFEIGGDPQPMNLQIRAHRSRATTEIGLDPPAVTQHPLLDASWRGSYSWLRYGFDGPPEPNAEAAPSPQDTVAPVIAVVRAIGTAAYAIEDRGPEPCPDGRKGYHVRLHARRDADAHPATDAIFDPATQSMCMLRFELRPGQFLHVPGSVELAYEPVGRYVIATSARIEFWGTIRHVGRNHVEIFVRYGGFKM